MKITYIHHSSFCVELKQVILLFDYYKGELPEFSEDKPLVVFASHFHQDHYSPVIFELVKTHSSVFYVLSEEIKKYSVPEGMEDRIRYVKAGEVFSIELGGEAGRKALAEAGRRPADPSGVQLTAETFESTDEGVAFWVQCEGKNLYHAGDLNNWWWEGEDQGWLDSMVKVYDRELDRMAGRHADAAFVPLDPRLGKWFYLGLDQFMKKVDAEKVFPMHVWKDYAVIKKLKELPESRDYRERIVEIHREGEEFIL